MHIRVSLTLAGLLVSAPAASGQDFNVDFGSAAGSPPATYAAAGRAGVWNTIAGTHAVTYPLVDAAGAATPVTVRNLGGTALVHANDAGTSGADQALMDEYLVTYSIPVETCLFWSNLERGTYEVITYAWAPTLPGVRSLITVDDANETSVLVGGAWPGAQAEGLTYAVHTVEVTDGTLNMHSGRLEFGGGGRAALNGVQIRRLPDCPADLDGDGTVSLADLSTLLAHFGATGGAEPDDGDLDRDGDVDLEDLSAMITAFGAGC